MAKVADFRPAHPSATEFEMAADSFDAGQSPQHAEVLFFGDSFGFVNAEQLPFWQRLSRGLGKPVFSIYDNRRLKIWENPYRFLDDIGPPARDDGLVILELVERNIPGYFGQPIRKTAWTPNPSTWKSFRENFFQETADRTLFLVKNNLLTVPFVTAWNTALFRITHRISPETPLYSVAPPMLFYREEVAMFQTKHSDQEISAVADHIALFGQTVREQSRRGFLFIPVPNKITLYSQLATAQPYDDFLPRLCHALDARGVATVKLMPRFTTPNELLFWPSDTHWNGKGISIATDETIRSLQTHFPAPR